MSEGPRPIKFGYVRVSTDDRFTAEAFAQQREGLWAWCRALEPGLTRERFDADFDAELRVMLAEEAADGQ